MGFRWQNTSPLGDQKFLRVGKQPHLGLCRDLLWLQVLGSNVRKMLGAVPLKGGERSCGRCVPLTSMDSSLLETRM